VGAAEHPPPRRGPLSGGLAPRQRARNDALLPTDAAESSRNCGQTR